MANLKKISKIVTEGIQKKYNAKATEAEIQKNLLLITYDQITTEGWDKPFKLELAFNDTGLFILRCDMFDIKNGGEKIHSLINDINYHATYLKALEIENTLFLKYYVFATEEKHILPALYTIIEEIGKTEIVAILKQISE